MSAPFNEKLKKFKKMVNLMINQKTFIYKGKPKMVIM